MMPALMIQGNSHRLFFGIDGLTRYVDTEFSGAGRASDGSDGER